jgi:hypothetical protein
VLEEDEYVGWGNEEQSDPSIHNCTTSCPLDFGLHSGRSRSFAYSDSQHLKYASRWGIDERNDPSLYNYNTSL